MSRTLIVAEKPAQAREYGSALGVKGKKQGYLENETYVITWCIGHLLELERPEAYMDLDAVGKRWSLRRLPVLPAIHSFRRVVKPSSASQFQVLKHWLQAPEIHTVICGTDADREGQLLFQEVWDLLQCRKPLFRLWLSSLTNQAINEGMKQLLTADRFTGLAAAAYGRSMADWDFGMNLTEGFTALFGSFNPDTKKPNVISIGRVQTPTLALIAEREWEIQRFIPEEYFEVLATFTSKSGGYQGKWIDLKDQHSKLKTKQEAEQIEKRVKGKTGTLEKVDKKEVTEQPPLLFDLTSLTVAASKRYGFSAENVLTIAQGLYEKKAITYPRTDCVYLPQDMIPKLPEHLRALQQEPYHGLVQEALNYGVPRGKRVINAITAHHAIVPTTEKINLDRLSDQEKKMYDLIARQFLAVWYPPALYEQTEALTKVEGECFITKGKALLQAGWKRVIFDQEKSRSRKTKEEGAEEDQGELPQLTKGEEVQTNPVEIKENTSKPPKRFTQGDLLKAMEGAGKGIDDEELRQRMKGKGIGTVATRPAIIENLMARGYIAQVLKSIQPTEKGLQLIALIKGKLPRANILVSAEMTGQMEFDLAQVEKGERSLQWYMSQVEVTVAKMIEELREYEKAHGKTPLAFAPANQKRTGSARRESSRKKASNVTCSTFPKNLDQVVNGKQSAVGAEGDTLGNCPRCSKGVSERREGYACEDWPSRCGFILRKNPICGKVLTPAQIKALLKKGKTLLIKGFQSKKGTTFSAYLRWEDEKKDKLKFEFEGKPTK